MSKSATKRTGKKTALTRGVPRYDLAAIVQSRISHLGLSRNDAAKVVHDAASQVSRLMTGHANEFSTDRLIDWLNMLGSDVTVTIRHGRQRRKRGKVRLRVD